MLSGSSKSEQLEPGKKTTKICCKQSNLSSFFKSQSSKDVVGAKSSSSSSLTLRDVEDDSNAILMVTLDMEDIQQGSLQVNSLIVLFRL